MWEQRTWRRPLDPHQEENFHCTQTTISPFFRRKKVWKIPIFNGDDDKKKLWGLFLLKPSLPLLLSFPVFWHTCKGKKKENFIFLLLCKRETVGFRRCQSQVLHEEALCQFFAQERRVGKTTWARRKILLFKENVSFPILKSLFRQKKRRMPFTEKEEILPSSSSYADAT